MTNPTKNPKSINDLTIGVTMVLGMLLAILIFKAVPNLAASLFIKWTDSSILLNLIEGSIKMMMFIGYILAISLMKDIRRVFQYHGAEHTVINTFEDGMELNSENFAKHTTIHPRCGTSFILVIIMFSIIVYSFIPWDMAWYYRVVWRLVLLLPIACISYEAIKFAGRHRDSWWVSIIFAPGLMLQRLTTRKPTEDQIEVAHRALQAVIEMEKEAGCKPDEAIKPA